MTITLELPPEVEARFSLQAEAEGRSIDDVVRGYLRTAPPFLPWKPPTPEEVEEMDRELDEIKKLVAARGALPLSGEAISRESIYTREDE